MAPDARAAPPYRRAAEPRAGRRAGPLNSVSPADATGRHRLLCPLRQFAQAAAQLPEWALAQAVAGIGIVGTAAPGRGAPGVVIMYWRRRRGAEPRALAGGGVLTGAACSRSGPRSIQRRESAGAAPKESVLGAAAGGAERDGITGPRFAGASAPPGCPVANGGRSGNAGRTGAGSFSSSQAGAETAGLAGSGAAGGGALFATGAGSSTASCRLPREVAVARRCFVTRRLFFGAHRPPRAGGDSARHRRRANWSASSYR